MKGGWTAEFQAALDSLDQTGRALSDEERVILQAVAGRRADRAGGPCSPLPNRGDLREALRLCPASSEWSESAREEALALVYIARSRLVGAT